MLYITLFAIFLTTSALPLHAMEHAESPYSMLVRGIVESNLSLVAEALENGASPDETDSEGILVARHATDPEIIQYLSDHGLDIRKAIDGADGSSLLHSAIRREDISLIYYLIFSFPDLLSITTMDGITPLVLAEQELYAKQSSGGPDVNTWKNIVTLLEEHMEITDDV